MNYKAYKRSRDEEKKLLDQFRDPLSPLKFVIVTSKLLTGFDAPILQCMYLDKPMKNILCCRPFAEPIVPTMKIRNVG